MGRKRKKIPAGPDSGLYRLSARRKTDRDNILQKGWKKKPQGGWAYTNSDGTEVSAPTMDLAIIFARKNEVLCTKCGCTDYIPAERKRRSICGNCREAGDEEEEEEEDGEGMEEMQEDVAPGSDADEESAVSGMKEDMEAELEEPAVTIKCTTTKTNSKKKRMIYIGCQRWRWDRLKGAYTLQNDKEVAQLLLDWYEMSGGSYKKNRDEASRQAIMATLADAHSRSWKRKKDHKEAHEIDASTTICPTPAGQDPAGLPGDRHGNSIISSISNLANTSQACDYSGGYTSAGPCETKTEDGSTVAPSSEPPVAHLSDTALDKDSTLTSKETQTLLGAHILECSSGSDEFNFGGGLQIDTVQVKVEPDDISDSCGSINIETVVKVEQVGETSEDHDHSDDAESELMHQDSVIIPEASDLGPAAEKLFSQTVDTEVEETKTRDLYSKGKVSGLADQSTSNQAGTSEASQGDVNHRLIPEVSGSPSFPSKEVLAQSADPNLKQKNSAEKTAHRKARQRLLRSPAVTEVTTVKQDSCLLPQTQRQSASGSTSGPCPHLSATGTSALRRADGEKKATAASVDPRDQHPPSETQNSSLGSKVSSSSVSCAPSRILVLRSGSGTETSVAVYEGPAAAAKLQEVESGRYSKNSQLPKSTAYYQKRKLLEDQIRAEKGEPPKKRYRKYKAHYTCRKCGCDRTKETGHAQVYGNWYCPFDPDRLPVEEWRALMKSKLKRK